jgi:hypothetical protein
MGRLGGVPREQVQRLVQAVRVLRGEVMHLRTEPQVRDGADRDDEDAAGRERCVQDAQAALVRGLEQV